MTIADFWRSRRALTGQSGFSTLQMIVGVGGAMTLAGLVAMNSDEQVGAAEQTACEYDKTIVMTAIDAYRASDPTLRYPIAAGEDGLDQVRAGGWLRTESQYWRFAGVDGAGHPQIVVRSAVTGCD